MVLETKLKSEFVIVDTSAFIRNASLQEIGEKIITVPEVVNEIKSKRQLRRLVVLPYDLQIKEAFPENISYVSEFAKKTGDYPSLSSTDLKVMALTYQLEKEHVGVEHLKSVPQINRSVDYCNYSAITAESISGFYKPKKEWKSNGSESSNVSEMDKIIVETSLAETVKNCNINEDESEYLSACSDSSSLDEFLESEEVASDNRNDREIESNINDNDKSNVDSLDDDDYKKDGIDNDCCRNDIVNNIFVKITDAEKVSESNLQIVMENNQEEVNINEEEVDEDNTNSNMNSDSNNEGDCDDDDDDIGWITPGNIKQVKQEMDADNLEEKPVKVACLTMDFAMQNVLKQMGLNVLSLDGRVIKQMRTFILRCYACFKTTSIMTRVFCHHCGNKTLKKVAVSLDAEGNQKIHINLRRPLTGRGKKFSLPKPTGGKHSNYPILSEDQPMPDQRPSRLARMKNNPLEPDYIAGFSPFVMRDVNSKSAMLGIQNKGKEIKYWMKRNPNESFGKRKKKK